MVLHKQHRVNVNILPLAHRSSLVIIAVIVAAFQATRVLQPRHRGGHAWYILRKKRSSKIASLQDTYGSETTENSKIDVGAQRFVQPFLGLDGTVLAAVVSDS